MKKFETITEYELIKAAYFYYLDKWYNEDKKLEENPNDIIAQHKVKEYWKIQKELHDRIVELEKTKP